MFLQPFTVCFCVSVCVCTLVPDPHQFRLYSAPTRVPIDTITKKQKNKNKKTLCILGEGKHKIAFPHPPYTLTQPL